MLLKAGYNKEILPSGLAHKFPQHHMASGPHFEVSAFGIKFDYVFSYSLWSHLLLEEIKLCLEQVVSSLAPHGAYFTTLFLAPEDRVAEPIPRGIIGGSTYPDRDPFHHTLASIEEVAGQLGLRHQFIGKFGPDNQTMLRFNAPA